MNYKITTIAKYTKLQNMNYVIYTYYEITFCFFLNLFDFYTNYDNHVGIWTLGPKCFFRHPLAPHTTGVYGGNLRLPLSRRRMSSFGVASVSSTVVAP